MEAMRLGLAVALFAAFPACGDDGFEYEGEPGTPVAARFESWVPAVDIAVDDGSPGNFLIDTGAPFTVVDTDSYPILEDGLHELDLSGFALFFPSYPVAAFDAFTFEQGGEAAFDGIVGGDLFSQFSLSLDYRGDRVWLDDDWDMELPVGIDASAVGPLETGTLDVRGGGSAIVPGDCPVTCGIMEVPATRALVEVRLEDAPGPTWMLVDTGASAVVLDESVLAELSAEGRPRLDGVTVGTAEGDVTAYFTRVWSMRLEGGDVEEKSVPALVLPDDTLFEGIHLETGVPVRGMIGGSFLRAYLTTLDFVGERLALARYVDQSHVDQDEFVRVGFTMTRRSGRWDVQDVYPGTDAAAEGLISGETIAEIDGQAIGALDEAVVSSLLGRFGLGEEVPVGVSRGAETQVLLIEVEDLLPHFESP